MTVQNHIFISYKSEQLQFATVVRDKLHEWGYETWLDVDRLRPGAYWANDIDRALKTCGACLGILTSQALKSRNVTNEWDMAIMKEKLFIPLMFERTEPHYKYLDIQYIDFSTVGDKARAFNQLKTRLDTYEAEVGDKLSEDPYRDYLLQLYDRINRFLSAKLITSLRDDENRPEPVPLTVERVEGAVDMMFEKRQVIDPLFAIGGIDQPLKKFEDFAEAFKYYEERVLLLGQPGAGKTITLLQYARDAVVKRKQNVLAPLPILGIIPTWDADKQPSISKWLSTSFGAPANSEEVVNNGQALLLLDGLDELGSERLNNPEKPEEGTYDPRLRFLQQIPDNNFILLTCRVQDYDDIGSEARLRGAIELKPLSEKQINAYLKGQPKLIALIESDFRLREWLDTPLLLSFFAFAYENMPDREKEQLLELPNQKTLRDKLIEHYVSERYRHESNKPNVSFELSLEELYENLGIKAAIEVQSRGGYLSLNTKLSRIYEHRLPQAINMALRLNFGVIANESDFEFIHLLVRDYFAEIFVETVVAGRTKFLEYILKDLPLEVGAADLVRQSIQFWGSNIKREHLIDYVLGLVDLKDIALDTSGKLQAETRDSKLILHIEDEMDWLEIMRDEIQLRYDKVSYIGVESGAAGLVLASMLKPDLIISDINHPGLDGMTTIDYLRSSSEMQNIPILMLTAWCTTENMRKAFMDFQVVDFLDKGRIELEAFLKLIEPYLETTT